MVGQMMVDWILKSKRTLKVKKKCVTDIAGLFERYPKSQQPWAVCSTGHQKELFKSLRNNFGIEEFTSLIDIVLEIQEKGTAQVPLNSFSTTGVALP